jgi:hypothetical protein
MKKFHPIRGKTVYIIFQSKGLGDTLAWFPYVEQFRIDNECKVKLYLPFQDMIPLFKPNYPEIEYLDEDTYIEPFGGGKLCFGLPMTAEGIMTYKVGYDNECKVKLYLPYTHYLSEIVQHTETTQVYLQVLLIEILYKLFFPV